jgi:hypothetical protein
VRQLRSSIHLSLDAALKRFSYSNRVARARIRDDWLELAASRIDGACAVNEAKQRRGFIAKQTALVEEFLDRRVGNSIP